MDANERPNVFRIAPTDRGIGFRLAEYLIPKGLRVALLTDDTGTATRAARRSTGRSAQNPEAVATKIRLPSAAPTSRRRS